jgi:hypothetical protein
MAPDAREESAAAARTRAKCKHAEVRIGEQYAVMFPIIAPNGTLNSLQSLSPPTEGGGYLLVVVEPIHAEACDTFKKRPCTCGGQLLLEHFVFGHD